MNFRTNLYVTIKWKLQSSFEQTGGSSLHNLVKHNSIHRLSHEYQHCLLRVWKRPLYKENHSFSDNACANHMPRRRTPRQTENFSTAFRHTHSQPPVAWCGGRYIKPFAAFATCKTAYRPDHVSLSVTLLSDQPCVRAYVHHLLSVRTFQLQEPPNGFSLFLLTFRSGRQLQIHALSTHVSF